MINEKLWQEPNALRLEFISLELFYLQVLRQNIYYKSRFVIALKYFLLLKSSFQHQLLKSPHTHCNC